MPFKSEKQRKWMHANEPEMAKKWEKEKDMNESERDYKAEYKKYGSSTKAKKYRAELNQYNRKKGTYGNGDGKDASHKGGKIAGFEKESVNRGRREKSRLKKESDFPTTTKKEKTVTVVHKKSGKELVIVDKPQIRKKYKRMGYVVESKLNEIDIPKFVKNTVRGRHKVTKKGKGYVVKVSNPFDANKLVKFGDNEGLKIKAQHRFGASEAEYFISEGKLTEGFDLKKLEDAIKMFQKKIAKQGSVTNARDEDHLKQLIKVYKQMGGKKIKEGKLTEGFEKFRMGGLLDSKLKKKVEVAVKNLRGNVLSVGNDYVYFRMPTGNLKTLAELMQRIDKNKNVWITDKRTNNIWDIRNPKYYGALPESVNEFTKVNIDKLLKNPKISKLLKKLSIVKLKSKEDIVKVLNYFAANPHILATLKTVFGESVNEAKSKSFKFKFQCMECGKSFIKSLKKSLEVKCPKCKSVDIELENINESDLGLTYKKGKTVKVTHKKSGKELIIIDKPNVRKEYEKIGFFAEGTVNEAMTMAPFSSQEAKQHVNQDIKKMSKHLGKASQQSIKIMMDGVKGGKYTAMDISRGIKEGPAGRAHFGELGFLQQLWNKVRDGFRRYSKDRKLS